MDEVTILHDDLVMFQAALSNALGLAAACDLQTQFQAMATNPRTSPLVKSLRAARDRCDGYIAEIHNDEMGG